MPLELHVWGPAFDLPSIDPECLAALSYLAYAVPQGQWTLIASNDAAVSPDNILPAIYHEGTWVSGYMNIVSYLVRSTPYAIDSDLVITSSQRADTLAYASYLTSRGSALLAFSLYVSPSAWADLTRPAYSTLLPFPLTWTVPLHLRAVAIAKTSHLGLDHLAAEVDLGDGATDPKTMAPATSTGFLRLPTRPGLRASMQPEQAAAIRLQSLAEDFFAVLNELRGSGTYFLGGEKPSSLDFLAFAYLRLMLVQTPHPFVANCMTRSAPGSRLKEFVDLMGATFVPWRAGKLEDLPWAAPAPRGAIGIASTFADGVMESVPGLGEVWKRRRRGGVGGEDGVREPAQVVLAVGGVVAALAALGAGVLFKAMSPFGAATHRFDAPSKRRGGLHQFGEIGVMFENLPGFEPPQSSTRDTLYKGQDVEVAVDVEAEGLGTTPPRDGNVAEVGVGVSAGDGQRK